MSSARFLEVAASGPKADTATAPANASVERLMDRYVEGDAAAFDELYRALSPKLFAYLLRLTRNRERAEDLLQITFAKLHRARTSYMAGAPLLPWVLAIARRAFYDERRAAKSRHEDLSNDGTLPEPRGDDGGIPVDLADALDRALDRLPEGYREAIQLTKITGLSLTEAAEVLGTTASAVKLRVHRGYNLLRKELDAYSRGS
ncbi:MAG TPA: RNA polymerase sigma factor [Polyangiaceae bacterium]|nr:RNA polymerase sigma factor [Polyangiaceae bacterium]